MEGVGEEVAHPLEDGHTLSNAKTRIQASGNHIESLQ